MGIRQLTYREGRLRCGLRAFIQPTTTCDRYGLCVRITEAATKGTCEGIAHGSELLWQCLL